MELPGCGAWAGCAAWGDAVWERDVEFSGCVAWGDAIWERDGAWGVVEALAEDADASFRPVTCDCAGATLDAFPGACTEAEFDAFGRATRLFPFNTFPCAFKPVTCDCDGAEVGLQEMGVCRTSFFITSVLPTQRQAAVVPVQKKPTHSEHPKT